MYVYYNNIHVANSMADSNIALPWILATLRVNEMRPKAL